MAQTMSTLRHPAAEGGPTFMGIAAELRLKILDYVDDDERFVRLKAEDGTPAPPRMLLPGVFNVNKQVRRESKAHRAKYWDDHVFVYHSTQPATFGFDRLVEWLTRLPAETPYQIDRIHIKIDEWSVHMSPHWTNSYQVWSASASRFVRFFEDHPYLLRGRIILVSDLRDGHNTRQPQFGAICSNLYDGIKAARKAGRVRLALRQV